MPRESTDRRKSSLGTRRGPPRQHIPFRADDLARGKKTGMAVMYVDRNSDEFEPFEQVIKQADNRTPPRIRAAKRKGLSFIAPVREEIDEDGEMSMDLAESNQGSPLAYFTNTHQAFAPNSSRRTTLSRTFDSFVPPQQDESPPRSFALDEPDPAPYDDYEPPQPYDSPPRSPSRDPSPSQAVADSDDGEAMEVEDVVADQEMGEVEDAQDEEEEAPPPRKSKQDVPKPKEPQGRPQKQKRVVKPPVERSPTPEGLRRGRRVRFSPLDWWRQEKVVYGRRESGLTLVPQIKEIIRIPQEPPRPLGKAGKRKRGESARAKSKARDTPFNPEEGWDDETLTNATVVDYDTKEEVSRRVAFLAGMIDPKPAANSSWFFQKIFGEGEFIAAGQMHIPPKGQKPSKSTKDNTYVFYVIQGAVSVFIHETNFIITTGGMFLVPRGNTYYIENIAERDAKLFFTQARMMPADDLALQQHTAQSAPPTSYRRAISDDPSAAPKRGKA